MSRIFFAIASLNAALAVAGGAFAAHALKAQIPESMLSVFETGVRYHMYHALALLAVALGLAQKQGSLPWLVAAGWAFVVGIVVFSGSLYALSLSGIRILGAITPLGGVAFLAGWICLFIGALRTG